MKKIIIATVLSLSSLVFNPAQADTLCEATYNLAGIVMQMRQDNAPRELVESVINSEVGLSIVALAYRKAIVPSDEAKRLVARNFASSLEMDCQRVRNNPKTTTYSI